MLDRWLCEFYLKFVYGKLKNQMHEIDVNSYSKQNFKLHYIELPKVKS